MTTLKLLSWNVHGLPDLGLLGGSKNRKQRLAAVAQWILDHRPDVVLLQELWYPEDARWLGEFLHSSAPRLARPSFRMIDNAPETLPVNPWIPLLGQLAYVLTARRGWRMGGLLAFVREDSGWWWESDDFYPYRAHASSWKIGEGDGQGGKGVQRVTLAHESGQRVVLFNTHLQSEYGTDSLGYWRIRKAQMCELTRWAEREAGDHPVVCVGDFNTAAYDPPHPDGRFDADAYTELTQRQGWVDLTKDLRIECREAIARGDFSKFWWMCQTHVAPADENAHWIDYVLTRSSEQWSVCAKEIEVLANEAADHPWSDHHGLCAELDIAPSSRQCRVPGVLAAAMLGRRADRRTFLAAAAVLAAETALGGVPMLGNGGPESTEGESRPGQ